jgi:lysophospholipase L1-like esterase
MRRRGTVVMCLIAGAVPLVADVAPAAARPRPTAAVSLGDSYISGEAGRWQGNSIDDAASRDGTDRAWTGTGYDLSRVYLPPSDTDGCHRSDVSEIQSASLPVSQRVNIACSGAVTQNIFRSADGGVGQDGELPQADQLSAVARTYKVKIVVLSIGGNDLGFSSIVTDCAQAYATNGTPCQPAEQAAVNAAFPTAMANVGKAIDEIRAVMSADGYATGSYTFILQGYPSAMPRGSEIRVPEIDKPAREAVDGCPFYDSDATWARDSVVVQIAGGLKSVAASRGVRFMDLQNLLQGREMCSVHTQLATPLHGPSPTKSDWARFLNLPAVEAQGQLQETFHPNAYGQQAFARCLTLMARATGNGACTNTAGKGPAAALLSPTS